MKGSERRQRKAVKKDGEKTAKGSVPHSCIVAAGCSAGESVGQEKIVLLMAVRRTLVINVHCLSLLLSLPSRA